MFRDVLLDKPTDFIHTLRSWIRSYRSKRTTSQARPQAIRFGITGSAVEADILTKGQPRRTRRSAIDTGSYHTKEKSTVQFPILRRYRFPAPFRIQHLRFTRRRLFRKPSPGYPISSVKLWLP